MSEKLKELGNKEKNYFGSMKKKMFIKEEN